MKSLFVRWLWISVSLSILACGSKSPTDPSGSGTGSTGTGTGGGSNPSPGTSASCNASSVQGTLAKGTLTAQIDNAAWTALCVGVSTSAPGVISIGGGENTTQSTGRTLAFAAVRAVGTTTIGPSSPTNALLTVGGPRVVAGRAQ